MHEKRAQTSATVAEATGAEATGAEAAGAGPQLTYKVVELSHVTDGEMETAINEWVAKGWAFDGVHFAMRDASKRPAMAFLMFTRNG